MQQGFARTANDQANDFVVAGGADDFPVLLGVPPFMAATSVILANGMEVRFKDGQFDGRSLNTLVYCVELYNVGKLK